MQMLNAIAGEHVLMDNIAIKGRVALNIPAKGRVRLSDAWSKTGHVLSNLYII